MVDDEKSAAFTRSRVAHWDRVAGRVGPSRWMGGPYHRRLAEVYRLLVPPGRRVLELGSGSGDLLAALQPSYGVGVDFSASMVTRARQRHPCLTFLEADVHDLPAIEGPFDAIILSDLVDDLWDVQAVLSGLHCLCSRHTRIILNFYNRLWEPVLLGAQHLGLSRPRLPQNWFAVQDVTALLRLTDWEPIRHWGEVLFPLDTALLAPVLNKYVARLWPFRHLLLASFVVARPAGPRTALATPPTVSVVVPARNEAGNIRQILARTPEMGAGTELIFVEGHSTDGTYAAIEAEMSAAPSRRCKLFRQTGTGKGDAVRLGFSEASGQVLMILDADLTMPAESLPRFYEALVLGKGDFINGVRLVYPMERQAMRAANLVANKLFSLAFTWLLGQSIKDTLCGTKVLWKADYERIAAGRSHFGDFDPFGDFDLLFGAARQGLQIVDLPIRYRERTYGTTQIQRWRHGIMLLRMCLVALRRLKFV